ncbi:thioredoxin domain-containing protein [Anaeromyces robustus]|uniref:Thioredoxin n=1 Tax=Anaeromyces robustus TaxID=1754192 RepID=A0A1Y1XLC3_9FUNG|nr:thioredoxin domain-containing protein [Anaeromyces robustus]|eukprot:ORX86559.1 thioredoxin domain-containing protein [Anaeromyces robustus]
MITEIENVEAYKDAISKPTLSVVDFYATWCGPCQMIHPVVEEFSETYTNVSFYQVDVDNASEVTKMAGIRCMPTFKFFKNSELVGEFEGAKRDELEEFIKKNM